MVYNIIKYLYYHNCSCTLIIKYFKRANLILEYLEDAKL